MNLRPVRREDRRLRPKRKERNALQRKAEKEEVTILVRSHQEGLYREGQPKH